MAGFSVVSPKSPEEAPFLALQRTVDAVVIGHSVDPKERGALIDAIRRVCPLCVIVFVYLGDYPEEPKADISLNVTHGAESLISELQQRLPRIHNNAA